MRIFARLMNSFTQAMQVLFRHFVIAVDKTPIEQQPERFNAVGMNLSACVFPGCTSHRLVLETQLCQQLASLSPGVGMHRSLRSVNRLDSSGQGNGVHSDHRAGGDLLSDSIQNTHHLHLTGGARPEITSLQRSASMFSTLPPI